jgi:hypothetical protein
MSITMPLYFCVFVSLVLLVRFLEETGRFIFFYPPVKKNEKGGHVTLLVEVRNPYKISVGKLERQRHLENLEVDHRMIFEF